MCFSPLLIVHVLSVPVWVLTGFVCLFVCLFSFPPTLLHEPETPECVSGPIGLVSSPGLASLPVPADFNFIKRNKCSL